MSIGELWLDIDKLDEINHRGLFAVDIPEVVPREERSRASVVKIDKHARRKGKGALLNDGAGPSNILPKGHEKGSVKRKAAQILSGAPTTISPRMRKSFENTQYSPSSGMGLSEWEIILEGLTRMGYIVKKEPDSDGNE
jgi:hypothetical protein